VAKVVIRFWAGAREAAGHDRETVQAATVAEVLAELRGRGGSLADVVARSSVLLDGRVLRPDRDGGIDLADGQVLEVLPPFAGG
jgi:molybdopterin converting factor small subunit